MKRLILCAHLLWAPIYGESFHVAGTIEPRTTNALTSCQATLRVHFPDHYTPQLFPLLSHLKQKIGDWKETHAHVNQSAGATRIELTIAPQRTGMLFYTPGVLFFQNSTSPDQPVVWLLPALSASCTPSGLSGMELAPLLPLHYDELISMSDANRERVMSPEVLGQEKAMLITEFSRRKRVWTAIRWCFLLLVVVVLLLWLASHFSQHLGPRRREAQPRDLVAEWGTLSQSRQEQWSQLFAWISAAIGMLEQVSGVALTYPELDQLISKSAHFSSEEKGKLGAIFRRLEAISYAKLPTLGGEWQKIISDLSPLVEEKLAFFVRESRGHDR